MARARLLDVPGHEPRQARAGRTLRLHLEPQFRGAPRLQGPHPSGLARHGGGGRDRRPLRRRTRLGLTRPYCADLFVFVRAIYSSPASYTVRPSNNVRSTRVSPISSTGHFIGSRSRMTRSAWAPGEREPISFHCRTRAASRVHMETAWVRLIFCAAPRFE